MCQQVVVEGSVLATPDTAIAVVAFGMQAAIPHGFGNQAPLHGHVHIAVERSRLVDAPAHGAMIQDDVIQVTSPDAVFAVRLAGIDVLLRPRRLVTQAETHEADDDIVSLQDHRIILQADTVAGSRLACDGQVSLVNFQIGGQGDEARHVKHDSARSGLAHRPAKRAFRTVIGQLGHMQDLAAAAAGGVHSPTLGSREGPGDAILFHRRDGELLIILVRRLWSRTGLRLIVFFRGGGQGGSPGGSQFSGNTAHRERIGCSGGQRPDHGIARIDALAFLLDAAFHELPFIGCRPAHRIPLKGQRGLRGAVEDQS